jgi:GT2 family glycosyltransferase
MERHPKVGIAGGRSEDPDTTAQHCCFRFPNAVSELSDQLRLGVFDRIASRFLTRLGIPEQPTRVDWVSGAFMMVRDAVFDDVGSMDESYFLYFEETDFLLRAHRRGWECWHVPQSRVVHLVGQSTGVGRRTGPPPRLPAYWFESRRRYFVLNHGLVYAVVTDMLVIAGHLAGLLRSRLQRNLRHTAPYFGRDLLRRGVLGRGRAQLADRRIAV